MVESGLFYSTVIDPVLAGMRKKVNREIPERKNVTSWGSRIAEFFAGREHHRNFKQDSRLGGLKNIAAANQLTIQKERLLGNGAFCMLVCKKIFNPTNQNYRK